jgi:hypothetical protein
MTIRNALRWWFRFLFLGLMTVGVLAESWRVHSWFAYYLRITVLVLLGISVMGAFVLGFICPRCRRSLLMSSGAIFSGRLAACPKCGVGLDELVKNKET